MCYEAGPNGFALMRRLEAMGPVIVAVIAPTLTPRRSGQRVKTDPIDARKLAFLFRAGELTEIAIPNEQDEAARDLVRTYHRVVRETTRKRHHILKFLIRRGRIYRRGANWTQKHRQWLGQQEWTDWSDEVSFQECNIFSMIPRSWATWATLTPSSRTSFTASSLNSRL